jgi:hypothetical protein
MLSTTTRMSKPQRRQILVIAVLGILVMGVVVRLMGEHDYRLVASGSKPLFTYSRIPFLDGGSIEYRGFGYRVTAFNRMLHSTPVGMLRRVGPELSFWLPIPGVFPTRDASKEVVNRGEGM